MSAAVLVRAALRTPDAAIVELVLPRGLVARLHATLRRAKPDRDDQPRLELDSLEIDLAARRVRLEGEEVHLTPIELKLLRVLVRTPGRTLTHRALLQQVWGRAYAEDTQTLRAHMANLRRKIERAQGEPLIRTYHGIGYRLAASVHATTALPGEPGRSRLGPLAPFDPPYHAGLEPPASSPDSRIRRAAHCRAA